MNRAEFDHAIRAAGGVLGENEIVVIGSQALHASADEPLPNEALRSVEADVAALDDPDALKADLIDGSIGEASMFHESFGYYAQGVSMSTAILPDGWRDRAVRYQSPATNGVVAICPEIHDLWISKAVALREKDIEFCVALIEQDLVDPEVLRERLIGVAVADDRRSRILTLIG